MSMALTDLQKARYERQLLLDGFDESSQQRLLSSKVLLIGAGGLGSPVAFYLGAAGIGTLGVMDADEVSISNLQRQIMYTTPDIGQKKVELLSQRVHQLNPDVNIITYPFFLDKENAAELVSGYDFVIDATDNFASKYLINDTCLSFGKAFTMGGIHGYSWQLMTHIPGSSCYRCIFPEVPASPSQHPNPVLGTVAGMMGTLQATECIKYLTGTGGLLTDRLLTFDTLSMESQTLHFHRNEHCICNYQ